jgi:hypothetical protein
MADQRRRQPQPILRWQILGECGDSLSAIEKILKLSPDVVFPDVQMPGMDVFKVLKASPGRICHRGRQGLHRTALRRTSAPSARDHELDRAETRSWEIFRSGSSFR